MPVSAARRPASTSWRTSELLAALPVDTQRMVRRAVAAAAEAGLEAHLVGGPVRDLLLDREIRDVDLLIAPRDPNGFATFDADASPAGGLAEQLASSGGRVVTHGRFGTVRIEEEGAHVDLASARTETYRRPGALPEVAWATIDEDLLRRDFSVNAMTIPLAAKGGGEARVHDPLDGLVDLESARLRVLHERSFHDDPTRALRAARLGARLGFSLARGTRSALRGALRDGAFGGVSGERLRREIQRCFSDARLGLNPAAALRLLDQWHVLPALEPGLKLPKEAIAPLRRFGRFVEAPLWKTGATPPWQAGMAIWLASLPSGLGQRTLGRMSIRGDVARRIGGFRKQRDRLLPKLRMLRGRGGVDELLAPLEEGVLEALWAWSEPAERKRIVRWAAEDRPRRSPVTGADVTALGLAGPDVGRVLARVRAAFLDGDVANREEALALAQELSQRGSARSRVAGAGQPRQRAAGRRVAKKPAAGKRTAKKKPSTGRQAKASAASTRRASPEARRGKKPGSDG